MINKVSVFWFRRDLRLKDNVGLYHALSAGGSVLPIFIFDNNILSRLANQQDRRVDYIHQALTQLQQQLQAVGTCLQTFQGDPIEIFQLLERKYDLQAVYCNRDYEPQTIARDTAIYTYFRQKDIPFRSFKDHVIFEKANILKNDGSPYTVYTPYAKKWKERLDVADYRVYHPDYSNFLQQEYIPIPSLEKIGFEKTDLTFEFPKLDERIVRAYDTWRDYPAKEGTTRLGMALRFGTISVRQCVAFALQHSVVWLNELIWREFFIQILYHFPRVVQQSFKAKYDTIPWRNDEEAFERWCEGKTGYPFVDAGMRELNQTGNMHNRVRMIAASFLCKHLLIDWRWGEAYFAQKLNDYELAANNGNWQWAAGSGCDAAPYFRVFNPTIQMNKFDKGFVYINKWLPDWGTAAYPKPIVEHAFARNRALEMYGKALQET